MFPLQEANPCFTYSLAWGVFVAKGLQLFWQWWHYMVLDCREQEMRFLPLTKIGFKKDNSLWDGTTGDVFKTLQFVFFQNNIPGWCDRLLPYRWSLHSRVYQLNERLSCWWRSNKRPQVDSRNTNVAWGRKSSFNLFSHTHEDAGDTVALRYNLQVLVYTRLLNFFYLLTVLR